jgi:MFS family permease
VFRALWIAGLASNVGTWMQNVGAAWLMTSLAPTPFWVSMVQAASSLPFFLLAIPAGALADVVDRRRLLLWALAWLLACTALLAGLALADLVGPGGLLALTFAIGVGSTFVAPAFLAIIPELVPREEIPAAVSLNGISMNLARAAGPAAGGLLVAAAGVGFAFLANALSYLGVIGAIARWRRPPREGRLPPEDLIGAMRAGLRYVRHSQPLAARADPRRGVRGAGQRDLGAAAALRPRAARPRPGGLRRAARLLRRRRGGRRPGAPGAARPRRPAAGDHARRARLRRRA